MIGLIVLLTALASGQAYIVDPGPVVQATVGEVWPEPQNENRTDNFFLIDPKNFQIMIVNNTCDILKQASKRYSDIIENIPNQILKHPPINLGDFAPNVSTIREIALNLTTPCEHMPYMGMDERYNLTGSGYIVSDSVWGILRGLETYSQLITPLKDGQLCVPEVRIRDYPRFPHRGLLLDTSRHYMSMETILKMLDGMEYNKLNVFHWHIVDDHSFPYQSITFPELIQGAYRPDLIYTQEDIAKIIEYARLRGIRVLAEFDIPGHTRSWGVSHPELLAKCQGSYNGKMGPINPIKSSSYQFLDKIFKEVLEVFPERYVHLGGDEVELKCWESNKNISAYVEQHRLTFKGLQKIFMENVTRMIIGRQATPIVWDDAVVKGVNLPKETVIQVWNSNWRDLMQTFTSKGHRVLMSDCWYLDHLLSGGDWIKFYRCEPQDFSGTAKQKTLVIGGEACMWSEVVNDRNVLQRIFPRVSAAAERLWSPRKTKNINYAKRRIEEHTCRMIHRGIPAQPPIGPGIC